ncbi:MAG: Calx-beta domain-containing protein, partial [Planctomycetota bacterium]
LTIEDDAGLPMVSFDLGESSVAEDVVSTALTVSVSPSVGDEVTVDYAVTGGTATNGEDYVLAGGTLTFSVGGDESQDIVVSVSEDALDEFDETVVVTLSNLQGTAALVAPTAHTLTIVDNDPLPEVSFALAASSGPETETPVNLVVNLSAPSGRDVTVGYHVSGGDAIEGVDYTLAAGPLTFAPGETPQSIVVTVTQDGSPELDETLEVSLDTPTNATLGAITAHVYTILADTLPDAPTGLTHTAHTEHSITWAWQDNSDNETEFRGYAPGDVLEWTAPADATSHTETGLPTNTQHTRTVRAFHAGGQSDPSNQHSAYTAIETPTGIFINSLSTTTIAMTAREFLTNLTVGQSGVYFEELGGHTGGIAAWTAGVSTDTATGLMANTPYQFHVKARNGEGAETPFSPTISKWTLSALPDISADKGGGPHAVGTVFTFTNVRGFGPGGVDHYLYAWVKSASYTFSGAEPRWSAGTLALMGDSLGDWYIHVLSRNGEDVASGQMGMGAFSVSIANEPPVTRHDVYSLDGGGTLIVEAPGVLANDTDGDGHPLTAVLVSDVSDGTLTLYANGSFTYSPGGGFPGSDSFTYKTNDGLVDGNTARVTITDLPPYRIPDAELMSTGDFEVRTASGSSLSTRDALYDVAGEGVVYQLTLVDETGDPDGKIVMGDDYPGGASLGFGHDGVLGTDTSLAAYGCYEMVVSYISGPLGTDIDVSLYLNTGLTDADGFPVSDPTNDTYWESEWTPIALGETRALRLDFNNALANNISDNKLPHTEGGAASPDLDWYAINGRDCNEICNIGIQIADFNFGVLDEPIEVSLNVLNPTAAQVQLKESRVEGRRVVVEWETSSEAGTVGFHVVRRHPASGEVRTVGRGMLPGLLHRPEGGHYRVVDADVEEGETYAYDVVEVEAGGRKRACGTCQVTVAAGAEEP